MPYALVRPLLFAVDPETAHRLALDALSLAQRLGFGLRRVQAPVTVMGLNFPNPVGLAAGLDKDGAYIDALAALGFGFLEIGTVTPRPQDGNPRPRLFRLPAAQALINRMGFNNGGVAGLLEHLRDADYRGVLGINLGKNRDTPLDRAADDYLAGMQQVYARADYLTINLSSPNTPGLRDLQQLDALRPLLQQLATARQRLSEQHGRRVPLVVKIAPDLADDDLPPLAELLVACGIDGVIATNTTLSRQGVEGLPHAGETGGLSGAPLTQRALEVVRLLHRTLGGALPIIAAGGIMSAHDARERCEAGASLVQLYSGLIYRGPGLIAEVAEALRYRIADGSRLAT